MRADGAVAFGNLFPLGVLRKLRKEVLRRHNAGELRDRGLVRDIGGRYAAVLPFEGPFLDRRFFANPKLLQILKALLGVGHCIGSLETVIAMPGSGEQHQHIDGPLRFDRWIGKKKSMFNGDLSNLPAYAVTLCVPLCDVDEDNGPTALWPGSHRTALRPKPPGEDAILREFPEEHMVGKFGQSFLFDYRTFHCGMPNLTRERGDSHVRVHAQLVSGPELADVFPRVVITRRNLAKVPSATATFHARARRPPLAVGLAGRQRNP